MADATVTADLNAIQAGNAPNISGDSYLYSFDTIRDVTYTLQWCGAQVAAAQVTAWKSYCSQTVFNIWNPTKAAWNGKPFPWSGWATNDPGDNYFYKFIGSTICWALYSNDATLLGFMQTDRWPLLFKSLASAPEGGSREGTGYGLSHKVLFELYGIWSASTGQNIQATNSHCVNSILYWTHATAPGGKFMAAIGDQSRVSNAPVYDYLRALIIEAVNLNPASAAAPAGRWWGLTNYKAMSDGFNFPFDLLDISGPAAPPAVTFYQAIGVGHYFARSDWTPAASFLNFVCGTYDQSHGHQNHGAFDLWGGGKWLVQTENCLSHSGIEQGTDWHNMLRFESGGKIIGQTIGKTAIASVTDDGTTLTANLTLSPMYPNSGISWTRKLTYARPGTLTVADVCAVPGGTVPYFQLQFPTLPTVAGNVITCGKLQVTVVTPGAAKITIDDWKVLSPTDIDASSGGFRVNISDPANGGQFQVTLQILP